MSVGPVYKLDRGGTTLKGALSILKRINHYENMIHLIKGKRKKYALNFL
jgi:pantothenate kinase